MPEIYLQSSVNVLHIVIDKYNIENKILTRDGKAVRIALEIRAFPFVL